MSDLDPTEGGPRREPPYVAAHGNDACDQCTCLGCYAHPGETCRCTPNQVRARDVIAYWLAETDACLLTDGRERAADGLLGALADAGLQVVSEGDDSGPAP